MPNEWDDLALSLRSSQVREPLKRYLDARLSKKTHTQLLSGLDVDRGRALELIDLIKDIFDPLIDTIE